MDRAYSRYTRIDVEATRLTTSRSTAPGEAWTHRSKPPYSTRRNVSTTRHLPFSRR